MARTSDVSDALAALQARWGAAAPRRGGDLALRTEGALARAPMPLPDDPANDPAQEPDPPVVSIKRRREDTLAGTLGSDALRASCDAIGKRARACLRAGRSRIERKHGPEAQRWGPTEEEGGSSNMQ